MTGRSVFRVSSLVVGSWLSLVAPVIAQEYRENPFLPTQTDDEVRRARDREIMRDVVREMIPEIQAKFDPALNSIRTDIETLKKAVDANSKSVSAADIEKIVKSQLPAALTSAKPTGKDKPSADEPKFISCVNGKAMLREKDGTNYIDDSEDGRKRCAS